MPTLHDTTVMTKKVGLWAGLGIGGIFLIIFLFRVGVGLKEFFVPTGPPPPTTTYGKLPAVTFPANVTSEKLTYALDTISGFLPTFSDKLTVFPVAKRSPSLLDLQRARQRVAAVGFTGPERKIDETRYSWNEATSLNKTITMDVISSHFMMTSQYGTYPPILESQNIPDENGSSGIARGYLEDMELLPEDIEFSEGKINSGNGEHVTRFWLQ